VLLKKHLEMTANPFLIETEQSLVAIKGLRDGYIQLAPAVETTIYTHLPDSLFQAAKAWAVVLEAHGAKRVYWLTLSEVVTHLHIHLYPRWLQDEPKGLPLFEARDVQPHPLWSAELQAALHQWAQQYDVAIVSPSVLD